MTLLMLKEPKTFDEQIDLLKSRGLIIGDEEKAKFILSNINYYRFSAYLIHFKKEDEKNNHRNKLFIKHHNEKYNGVLPIWVAVEIMSFGTLSKLYSNMLPQDTTYIKKELCNVNPKLVNSWLHSLTHLRNVCAHYGRIYNTYFPPIKVKNSDKNNIINDRQIFTYILAIKHLIADKNIWNDFFIKLQALFYKYDNYIELELLGFPKNWVSILSL